MAWLPKGPVSDPAPAAVGASWDAIVPSAYSVPDPDAALAAGPGRDPIADAPPVASVFSDPAPGAGTPASPAPDPDAVLTADPQADEEAWYDTLRAIMDQSPRRFGYPQSDWTAPLLGRYLMEKQGYEPSLPRLRKALKDLGYRWEHTRYVRPA